MTELQNYIFGGLGIATVLTLQWLLKKLFSNYDKNKQTINDAASQDRARMEIKLDRSILIQEATVYALCNMNTVPELKQFSKEFERTYLKAKEIIEKNPEMGKVL